MRGRVFLVAGMAVSLAADGPAFHAPFIGAARSR